MTTEDFLECLIGGLFIGMIGAGIILAITLGVML